MNEPDACWVCTDCYFAHHYGAYQHEETVELYDEDGNLVDEDVPLWYAGADDEPVGGWHEIRVNRTLDHNREPLGLIEDGVEVSDWTCSNHDNTEVECPVCDDGVTDWIDTLDYPGWPGYPVLCWVCDGDGRLQVPCPHCGSDNDENGIQEFAHYRCEGCGTPLGGSRHRLALFLREEATT